MAESAPLFKHILAATADAFIIDSAVVSAARLAGRLKARLRLVHTIPLVSVLGEKHRAGRKNGVRPGAKNPSAAATQSLLMLYGDHCPGLSAADVVITTGVAWEAVFRTALELDSDLIVIGPHTAPSKAQNTTGSSDFLGGTADGVIRRAQCPIMIANRTFDHDHLGFKKIVVGMDFSSSCAVAVCLAALLASHNSAFVSTFHMLPIPPYPKYTPQALQADRLRMQQRMNRICRQLLEGIDHQFFIKPGARPQDELLRFAGQTGADLIVMGSHTRERSGKWYSGSVVQQVACNAHCPVMVVNGAEALTPWKDDGLVSERFPKTTGLFPHLPGEDT